MDNILITGGAGFIGSHVTELVAREFPDSRIVILDKMTYAADERNLAHVLDGDQRSLKKGDICDFELCSALTRNVNGIIHMAAESHVDNAFGNSLEFTRSNTLGTHTLLEAARLNAVPLFIHVSTDEVYGEIHHGAFDEDSVLNPSNPYSGSKASAEMIVNSYRHSFSAPVIIVRSNNIFGTRQFPEKIVPKFAMQAISGHKMTLHGDGSNRRRYLLAEELARALVLLIREGTIGEIYNIGCEEEYANNEVAKLICAHFGLDQDNTIEFIPDRPFNDFRYCVDFTKIGKLGWRPEKKFKEELPGVLSWYEKNQTRFAHLFEIDRKAS